MSRAELLILMLGAWPNALTDVLLLRPHPATYLVVHGSRTDSVLAAFPLSRNRCPPDTRSSLSLSAPERNGYPSWRLFCEVIR